MLICEIREGRFYMYVVSVFSSSLRPLGLEEKAIFEIRPNGGSFFVFPKSAPDSRKERDTEREVGEGKKQPRRKFLPILREKPTARARGGTQILPLLFSPAVSAGDKGG